MDIKRAKQEIKDAIAAYLLKDEYGAYEIPVIRQRPILLLGAPGIGKTQIMEQIARECGIGLVAYTITHHTRQSAIGLPFISEMEFDGEKKAVTEYTMSEIVASIYEKMKKTGLREGILFIDEINCVSETLAPAMLQFLQCKTFGNHPIPEGWIIVAAGNPPEYNKSVRDFDVVTLDRVKKIEVEPDYEVWREYALKARIHPAVISYLDARPGHFYRMETTVDGKRFATPRGWEDLSRLLEVYEKLGKTADKEVVLQYIQHEQIAGEFANYLELYRKYESDYGIGEILRGVIREETLKKLSHASFDERLSVVSLLLSGCMTEFHKVRVQELFLEVLYGKMKEAGRLLSEGDAGRKTGAEEEDTPESGNGMESFAVLAKLREEAGKEREAKKRAELLGREEEQRLLKIEETLSAYETELKKRRPTDGAAAFSILRELFSGKREQYERLQEEGKEMLEHAFDFLEAAFGDSQEMVIFLTGLNSAEDAVAFLQTCDCERYRRYNQSLLFRESDRRLRGEIDRLLAET